MERRAAISALCLAILALPLQAQMRGGMRGGGPMRGPGFSTGGPVTYRSAPSFAFPARAGVRFGTGFGSTPGVRFSSGARFGSTMRFGTGFRRPFFGSRRFRHPFFFSFYPWFYPYYGFPAYYGYPAYASIYGYSGYETAPAYDYSTSAYGLQSDITRQQADIDRLEDEVARLRSERESQPATRSPAPAQQFSGSPTVLVFHDGHRREERNYAIVSQTLWIFTERRAEKIPLSALDIDATRKANDERGVDFVLPQ